MENEAKELKVGKLYENDNKYIIIITNRYYDYLGEWRVQFYFIDTLEELDTRESLISKRFREFR